MIKELLKTTEIIKFENTPEQKRELLTLKPTNKFKIISSNTVLQEAGKPTACYFQLPYQLVDPFKEKIKNIRMKTDKRVRTGIKTVSEVFGSVPRVPLREDYCRFTEATKKHKEAFVQLCKFNALITEIYETLFPSSYARAMNAIASVPRDWKFLPKSPFLTININMNYAIPYHVDAANEVNALSNVLVIRENVVGGELSLPEYGITFAQNHGALILFEGFRMLHGVHEFKAKNEANPHFRASIVFYTQKGMKNCLSKTEEFQRFKKLRTEKENISVQAQREKLIGMVPAKDMVKINKKRNSLVKV